MSRVNTPTALPDSPVQVDWAPRPNALTCHRDAAAPAPATSVHAIVLNDLDQLLVVEVTGRGWDLPGGHIEPGETPDQALLREVAEETGLELTAADLACVGYCHLHVDAPVNDDYPYPHPDTYQPIYLVRVAGRPMLGTRMPQEIGRVAFLDAGKCARLFTQQHKPWVPLLHHVLGSA